MIQGYVAIKSLKIAGTDTSAARHQLSQPRQHGLLLPKGGAKNKAGAGGEFNPLSSWGDRITGMMFPWKCLWICSCQELKG